MDPIAFYIFGISIRWYGIFIALGVISATILAYYTCKFRNLNFDLLLDVVLISLPIGIIGARLYYVIFQFDYYKDNLIDILNIRQGGLAIHGGLIFGLLAAFITAKRKKIDFLSMVDVIAPSVIIAQALGRWGNFFNS
ncbi:MAG: prolipoprotein diacylglyceryl transferase, partial [Bacillota bacterium]|nr:prolipoprotein diacylglyceryl transferase [Bacillota bacterium]